MQKAEKIIDIWVEEQIIEQFGLSRGKAGKSRQIGNWVEKGLPYWEINGKRFFLEVDVVTFFNNLGKKQKEQD